MCHSRREFSKLVSYHILRDDHIEEISSIVDLELEADEVGQNSGRSSLRSDGRDLLARCWADDGETVRIKVRIEGCWPRGIAKGSLTGRCSVLEAQLSVHHFHINAR